MCKFASFILTRDREYWSAAGSSKGPDGDSHEDIVAEHGLKALDAHPIGLVRIELTPSETPRDLSTWRYRVDQDVWPKWTFRGDPELERRSREALARRAADEHWFAEVIAHQAVSGYAGIATADDNGSATSGSYGTSTSGDGGTSTSGDGGTSTSGYKGTSTSGYKGTSTSGAYGTSTSGDGGILNIRWWDGNRYRIATFYVGEGGIEPNTPYGCDDKGQPVKREVKP